MSDIYVSDKRSRLEMDSIMDFCSQMIIKDNDEANKYETVEAMEHAYKFINAMLRADTLDDYTVTKSDLVSLDTESTKYSIYSVNKIPDDLKDRVLEFKRYQVYQNFLATGDYNQYYENIYQNYFKETEATYNDLDAFENATSLSSYVTMRLYDDFSLLWYPQSVLTSYEILKFKSAYNSAKNYFLKVCYNEAYEVSNKKYKQLCKMIIILLAINEYLNSRLENIDDIDFFDEYSLRNMFLSYGLDYFFDMPLKYQRRVLKNINYLIKNKGTNKALVNILQIFGFSNIKIMRYILAKEYPTDPETGKILLDNPELKFYELSSDDEKIETAIANANVYDYDEFVEDDKYWNLTAEEQDALYKENFNYIYTKYISISSMMDMTAYGLDFSYFVNFIYRLKDEYYFKQDGKNNDQLFFYDFTIGNDPIYLFDAILTLYVLTLRKFNYKDVIISAPTAIAKVYDINLDEVIEDIKFYDDKYLFAETINKYKEANLTYINVNEPITQTKLCEVFIANKEFREKLEKMLLEQKDRRKYKYYLTLYKACFLGEYRSHVFCDFETFTDYLEVKSPDLHTFITYVDNKAGTGSDREVVYDQYILSLCNDIDTFLDNDELNFFVQGNSYLNDYIKEYIYQLVDFIKSYTIHVRNMDTMYIFDDRFSNCILYFDEAHIETDFAVPDLISVSDDVFNALTEMEVEPEQVMHEVEEFIFFQHNLKAYEHDLELSSLYKMFTSLKQSDIFVLLANKTDYRNFISEIEYCNHLDDYTTYSNISLKQKLLIDIRDIMFKYFDTKSELVSLLESTDIDNIYTIDLAKLVVSDKYEYLMNLILTDGHVVHFSKDKLIVDLTTCSYSENLGFSEDIYSIYEENHVEKLNIKESLTIESTVYENIFGFTDLINYCLIYEDMNIMRFDLNRLLNQNGIFQDLPENVIAIKNFGNVVFYYSEDGNKYYDFTYKDGILVLSKLHGPIRYVLLANAKIQYRNK